MPEDILTPRLKLISSLLNFHTFLWDYFATLLYSKCHILQYSYLGLSYVLPLNLTIAYNYIYLTFLSIKGSTCGLTSPEIESIMFVTPIKVPA